MPIKEWSSNYPSAIDTNTEQPTLVNNADQTRVSQIHAMRSAVQQLQAKVGSNLLESGTYLQHYATTPRPWISDRPTASTVEITSAPGFTTTKRVLQDGKLRSFTGTLTWDITVSGAGGMDTGGEPSGGANGVFVYLYLVPDPGDDDLLEVVGSLTDPGTGGPTGFTNYEYIAAQRQDPTNDLRTIEQRGPHFFYLTDGLWPNVVSLGPNVTPPTGWQTASLTGKIPVTAASFSISGAMDGDTDTDTVAVRTSDGVPASLEPTSFISHWVFLTTQGNQVMCNWRDLPYMDGNLYYTFRSITQGDVDLEIGVAGWVDKYLLVDPQR